MFSALKNAHDYFEGFKGKNLIILLVSVVFFSLIGGLFLGQTPLFLDENSVNKKKSEDTNIISVFAEKYGRVVYTNPLEFPNDNISYKLVDENGKDIILLMASDDKLKVIENSTVRLKGRVAKTSDGTKDVLKVEEVVFNK